MKTWFLLRETRGRSAAENMAVDQHLLEMADNGTLTTPVLRLYAWQRPTLSLGYHQQWQATVDREALAKFDIDLVRRWTGGRGVLHDHGEITYSLTAPIQPPFSRRVRENYHQIGTALARFTFLEASPASMAEHADSPEAVIRKRHLPCFASLSESEIEKDGRKLIGSAQKVGKKAFLQHGSIPLIHRAAVLQEITRTPQDTSGYMTSLTEHYAAAGLTLPSREILLAKLEEAFAFIFGIVFRELDSVGFPDETRVARIACERFLTDTWTFRK